jgi:thiosulfate reductase cytochrome b subunit
VTEGVLLYTRFERLWHWSQAGFVIGLLLTGFELHGSLALLGFAPALVLHQGIALVLVGLWVFAWFWHVTTGEWRQYRPAPLPRLRAMLRYYLYDIFLGRPHPFRRDRTRKLNPLQRLAYLALHLAISPALWLSGLALLGYGAWNHWDRGFPALAVVAQTHLLGAYAMLAFLIVHLYLALSTSETPFADLRAMVTGREPPPDEE